MSPPSRLHVVALAHLDTQWRWTVRDTVRDHLPNTVAANERLFERYPSYVLSFEGAHRYRLLAEHHPALFETVRRRLAEGRWAPAGAAVEAFDTLLPSPESILRQIVLGRRYFREAFGTDSRDLFLPDCFGFPATLPTLAAHAGIVGFSTQKLRRGELMRSANGIPFAFGRWRGPDGSEIFAALDPGEYSGRIDGELASDAEWQARFAELDRKGLPQRLLFYVGTGDRGGAAPETTIAGLERALGASGPIEVRHGRSEAIYLETTDDERARLPVYQGELLLRLHGTGCYSAKAILKRWNRRCESLAFAAEAAAALARSVSPSESRPQARIESAWWRFLAHQMHDDLTGTSIPEAYRFTLDALGLGANELAESLLDSMSTVGAALDRSGPGATCLVFSPLAEPHEELVEVALETSGGESIGAPPAQHVALDADGSALPCQLVERDARSVALVPVRFDGVEARTVRLVSSSSAPAAVANPVEVESDRLESARYRALFDERGRLASLLDKRLGRQLLSGPVELELLVDRSRKYPAWEIQWRDLAAPPDERVERLVSRAIVERGPLRSALRFEHSTRGCIARSLWSLAAGESAGGLVLELELDWRRRGRLLELRFPFAAANDRAFYDTGLGAIARPVASEALFEVPAQGWAAIEDASEGFGAAVLTDVPRGWNQPDRSTLRATLIHAPFPGNKFRHQGSQDFGRHRWRFALLGLEGGAVARGDLGLAADRFRHPALAFRLERGGEAEGPRSSTLLSLAAPLRLQALAAGRDPREIALRISNPAASDTRMDLETNASVRIVEETDALGKPRADGDEPLRALPPSGLRTIALRCSPAAPSEEHELAPRAVALSWTLYGFGAQGEVSRDGGFDGTGSRFPLELAPRRLDDAPVPFDLSQVGRGPDSAPADGSALDLGAGAFELWLLCASISGELEIELADGSRARVPDWREPLLVESDWRAPLGLGRLRRGSFRRRAVVWSAGHLHDQRGRDRPVERASLFALRLPIAAGAPARLPRAPKLRIVAATAAFRSARLAAEAFVWPEP